MPSVVITVDGVDVTSKVLFSTAHFSQRVNGNPGEGYMRLRDLDSTFSVIEGVDWLVTIDGNAAWRGYVTQAVETYIYPAGNVAESGLQRFMDLRGADQNVLFTKRVVFKKSNPAHVTGTQFPPGTDDITAIEELLANWLDLSDDDLDTSSGVTHVGDLDPDQTTIAWSGGWYWKDAMGSIGMLPAAIWYIRPETGSPMGTLVYCDVDEPTSPFGLSDQPNGTTTKGFREMEIVLDGTSLANDVLAWGMGYGSSSPVFKRSRATASIENHNLWQQGQIVNGVYKQGTINRIADSIINGSPSSHRGAKNDRPYVRLSTYEPGLLAGHVVEFTSNIWGWSDTIPVRELELSFESPTAPRYDLMLSHEIDAPWSFIDQFVIRIPRIPTFPVPGFPVPPGLPQPNPGEACECGITDDFDRADASELGTASSGYPWQGTGGEIVDNVAVIPTGGGPFLQFGNTATPVTVTVTVPYPSVLGGDDVLGVIRLYIPGGDFVELAWQEEEDTGSPSGWKLSTISLTKGGSTTQITEPGPIAAFPYDITFTVDSEEGLSATIAGYDISASSFAYRGVGSVYLLGFRVE